MRLRAKQDLPDKTLVCPSSSRTCYNLSEEAWRRLDRGPPGWAVCDFVPGRLGFGHHRAAATLWAAQALAVGRGVCRDRAHLAIALRRCLHIPARDCTGSIVVLGEFPDCEPMDFAAWIAVSLDGR